MIRSKLLIALLAAIPALALASPFSKDYTESMIVPDSISMGEAKLNLINKIRLDAANDAGARLKKVTTLTQVGTVDPDPVSIFSKTVVSLVHVQNEKYSFSTNKFGQVELVATANVLVDDAELQQADDAERNAKIQQQYIFQLEHENRDLKTQIANQPLVQSELDPVRQQTSQAAQAIPFIDELLQSVEKNKSHLSIEERNNNTLTAEQQVKFDQLCERFKTVDQLILNAGVQSAYLGTKSIKETPFNDGSSMFNISAGLRVTWDWTKEMKIIRHLMGDVGTVDGNIYTVHWNYVNDKALLVAIRKCERANHFIISVDGDQSDKLFNAFVKPVYADPNGLTYRLVFKGDDSIDVLVTANKDRGTLLNANEPVSVAQINDPTKFAKFNQNRLFGTEKLLDTFRFGNEEKEAEAVLNAAQQNQAQVAQARKTPSLWDRIRYAPGNAWRTLSSGPVSIPIVGGGYQ
jgi:hypothetical protein